MDGGCINGNPKMEATAEGRLYNHSPRLACLPRDIDSARNYRRRAVVEIPSPHRHRREATALFRNPVRGAKRMRAGILRSFSSRVPEVRHYLWRDG